MTTDPRPRLAKALDQTQALIDAIDPAHFDRPTPCDDYDVRTLLAHLLAVYRKLTATGRGEDATAVPDPAADRPDSWSTTLHSAREEFDQVWADDALLDRDQALPWAVMPGRSVLSVYTHEFTVHAWDLAQATGQLERLDPALSEAALEWFTRNVPAADRPEDGQFGPAIPVAEDADVHTRLAGFVGRTP